MPGFRNSTTSTSSKKRNRVNFKPKSPEKDPSTDQEIKQKPEPVNITTEKNSKGGNFAFLKQQYANAASIIVVCFDHS